MLFIPTKKLYHGTNKKIAEEILKRGFLAKNSDWAVLGKGVYFSENKKNAKRYGKSIIEIEIPDFDENKLYKKCVYDSHERPLRLFQGSGVAEEDEKWSIMFDILRERIEQSGKETDDILKICNIDPYNIGWNDEMNAYECLKEYADKADIESPTEENALEKYYKMAEEVKKDMINNDCKFAICTDGQTIFYDEQYLNSLKRKRL